MTIAVIDAFAAVFATSVLWVRVLGVRLLRVCLLRVYALWMRAVGRHCQPGRLIPAQLMADICAASQRCTRNKVADFCALLLEQACHRDAATRNERSTETRCHVFCLTQHGLRRLLPC